MGDSKLRVADIVFKHSQRSDMQKFNIDRNMLNVWMEIDGNRTLGAVADKVGIEISAIKPVMSQLLRLGLIEPKKDANPRVLDADFIEVLMREYSLAVGPIANVLIEEECLDLGYDIRRFPAQRVAELIDVLARAIKRKEKTLAFKQKMISKIREKGY
jgi:hypothetical protein